MSRGAIAIGNFDGVHLGHRALFDVVRRSAAARGGPACALTFEPHPARVFAPRFAPPLISSPLRKRELLAEAGVDDLVVQPFDLAFAATEPERFVERLTALGVADVIVGWDFTYGRERRGNVESLRFALADRGVALHVVPAFSCEGLVVSSTKVRELAHEGKLEAVAKLLGRPLDLDGTIVRGDGRGRQLGWPTANIRTAQELLPSVGVYAVRARLLESPRELPEGEGDGAPLPLRFGPLLAGAANLGLNPTFRSDSALAGGPAQPPLRLEVHLLDFDGDIYGRALRVEFVQRLREERRFNGPDALKAQIALDVAAARALLG